MAKPFIFTRMDLMRDIAEKTGGKTLLAFSRGRDSIAAFLTLRDSSLFHDIRLFHLDGCRVGRLFGTNGRNHILTRTHETVPPETVSRRPSRGGFFCACNQRVAMTMRNTSMESNVFAVL